jgi:hypothetical protein
MRIEHGLFQSMASNAFTPEQLGLTRIFDKASVFLPRVGGVQALAALQRECHTLTSE